MVKLRSCDRHSGFWFHSQGHHPAPRSEKRRVCL